MPSFQKLGRLVSRVMMPLVAVFVVLVVPCYLASNSNSFYYGSSHIFGGATKLGADTQEIEDIFGQRDTYVLMIPKDSTATETELSQELYKLPQVKSIRLRELSRPEKVCGPALKRKKAHPGTDTGSAAG